jgi:hypothetical protein
MVVVVLEVSKDFELGPTLNSKLSSVGKTCPGLR